MPHKYSKKRGTRKKYKTRRRRTYAGGNKDERLLFINFLADEGLGNLLFIFAAGLVAQEKFGITMAIVLAANNKHSNNPYNTLFTVESKVKIMKDSEAKQLIDAGEPILQFTDEHPWAPWSKDDMKYNPSSGKNAVLPSRFYQSYPGVQSVIPVVKDIMMTNEFSRNAVYRELEKATPEGSAFIHVRRGDYLEKGWELSEDYYIRGMSELNKDPSVKKIWIISNDLYWCKNVPWKTDRPIEYYDSKNELEVLYKMMLCTAGAVISASTFSAWGAMMGVGISTKKTANTKIVYPKNWFNMNGWKDNPMKFPDIWTGIPNRL